MKETDSMINTIKQKGVKDKRVLDALSVVNRALFVGETNKSLAYADLALPIGEGQTISQPYMVARMLELLELEPSDKVLEIGSGSGYSCAVLSKIVNKVIGIEINKELADRSRETLKKVKAVNVRILNTDGSLGYLPGYPYDKILISAATPEVLETVIEQLKPNGILVAPVGNRMHQTLIKIVKTPKGIKETKYESCMFVPLTGEGGF